MCLQSLLLVAVSRLASEVVDDTLSASSCIEHGLCGGESLADDHEESGLKVHSIESSGDIDWINVGKELEALALGSSRCLSISLEGLSDELWSEVTSSNSNSNDICDRLAGVSKLLSASDFVRESLDGLLDSQDILVNLIGVLLCSQLDVPHLSLLSGVDLLSLEHLGELLSDLHLGHDISQEGDTFAVNLGMCEIGNDVIASLDHQLGVSLSIFEEISEMHTLGDGVVVLLKCNDSWVLIESSLSLNHFSFLSDSE